MLRGVTIIFVLLVSLTFKTTGVFAGSVEAPVVVSDSLLVHSTDSMPSSMSSAQQKLARRILKLDGKFGKKATAVLLAVALGPFGVHRLYLGTDPKVPIAYTLTLGGGLGILPAADIIAILLTRDLDHYSNNSRFIMWSK